MIGSESKVEASATPNTSRSRTDEELLIYIEAEREAQVHPVDKLQRRVTANYRLVFRKMKNEKIRANR
ncbi:MAG: hypothetical protein ACE5KU_00160 [Nitrososphaerales archaeon]